VLDRTLTGAKAADVVRARARAIADLPSLVEDLEAALIFSAFPAERRVRMRSREHGGDTEKITGLTRGADT
jgi:hypothetical protein